jgi:sec-independent protein translocase protein TatA
MFGLRLPELLLILVVLLVLFGGSKLPQLGAGLGQGLRSFKKAFSDATGDDEPEPPAPPPRSENGAGKNPPSTTQR